MQFHRKRDPDVPWLFVADSSSATTGWSAVVVDQAAALALVALGKTSIDLSEALSNEDLNASFVFCARIPDLTGSAADKFQKAVNDVIALFPPPRRGILWFPDPRPRSTETPRMALSPDGKMTRTDLTKAWLTRRDMLGVKLRVSVQISLSPSADSLVFNGINGIPAAEFTGSANLEPVSPIQSATLGFAGTALGCIQFRCGICRSDLYDKLHWGFQSVYAPTSGPGAGKVLSGWYPLADGKSPQPTDSFFFDVSFDPGDRTNEVKSLARPHTAFWFADANRTNRNTATSALQSYYRTDGGRRLDLLPLSATDAAAVVGARQAYWVVCDGALRDDDGALRDDDGALRDDDGALRDDDGGLFQFAPAGDFAMSTEQGAGSAAILCGLNGTERILVTAGGSATAGDRLRFIAGRPAFIPVLPPPSASPLSSPAAQVASPVTDQFLTSWVSVVPGPNGTPSYLAQPAGSPLFGAPAAGSSGTALLAATGTPVSWPADPDFAVPMFPLAGISSSPAEGSILAPAQFGEVEHDVVAPYRGQLLRGKSIAAARALAAAARTDPNAQRAVAADTATTTTPSGLLVDIADRHYTRIQLGRTEADRGTPPLTMQFEFPKLELQHAFQSGSLFLVIANRSLTGPVKGIDDSADERPGTTLFRSALAVGDWVMEAGLGGNPAYGDYRDVMIVKARPGTLLDLVAQSTVWAEPELFAAPSTETAPGVFSTPDPTQIPILSQWLQDYVKAGVDAGGKGDPYFKNFHALATNPQWTGILTLRATVSRFPADLAGLAAGLDTSRFVAHHFGVNISPVRGSPPVADPSSVFGLIDYANPAYSGDALAPEHAGDYDFLVLSLRALFENTAVKLFQSRAQLTVNRLFGVAVRAMVDGPGSNPFNAILLDGHYQNTGGRASYNLSTAATSAFAMASKVLQRVAITGATLSTVSTGATGGLSRFDLSGLLDFAILPQTSKDNAPAPDLDLFSFGQSVAGQTEAAGLAFSNLELSMNYDGARSPAIPSLVFEAANVAFDVGSSTPRIGSLYRDFGLQLDKLVMGATDQTPADAGFLPVIATGPLAGVGKGNWYGLAYQLNLGTPGALAGKIGLTARILTAWGPGGTGFDAAIGLSLPGTGSGGSILSIQSVLKLAIGQALLARPQPANPASPPRYLLTLSDIALKLMGIVKLPPNGVTNFLLFGSPNASVDAGSLGWLAMYRQTKAAKADGS